jgi:hypothetical protein
MTELKQQLTDYETYIVLDLGEKIPTGLLLKNVDTHEYYLGGNVEFL